MRKIITSLECVLVMLSCAFCFAYPAKFGLSPDNAKAFVLKALDTANKKILLNVYEFEDEDITNLLIEKLKDEVTVVMLVEGKPVSQMSADSKKMLSKIRKAMTVYKKIASHVFIMESTNSNKKRRYTFDHAKYVVIDSKSVLISSENFTPHAFPISGGIGNRGWETLVDNKKLADELSAIFLEDIDPSFGDIVELKDPSLIPSPFIPFEWGKTLDSPLVGKRPVPTFAEESGEVTDAALITSPNALDDLVSLIDSAREHLELEFMSLPSTWLKSSGTRIQSPIVSALIAAAKRGVEVKVLLNNEWVFSPKQPPNAPPKPNMVTAQLLQAYAKCYNFPIAAKIVDEKALGITYIHNKGMLIDSEKAFINSINGTQNSVVANREVGVVLESPDAANYYEKAFQIDWEKSASIKPSSGCP